MKVKIYNRGLNVQALISFALAIVIGIMVAGVVISSLNSSVSLTGKANDTFSNTINLTWAGLGLLGILVIVVVAGYLMKALGGTD